MTALVDEFYFIAIMIPFFGLVAQWLAWRFHLPAIVLLSATGLILGPGIGLVQPDIHANEVLATFIKLSVAIILFEGGLYLQLFELKEVFKGVRRLIFPALPIAWLVYSFSAHYIGQISWPIALIFGAIIVVSGPTVVIPLLRQARLKRKVASYIKWEGIINDPLGALLAVLVFQFFLAVQSNAPESQVFWNMFQGLVVALVTGIGGGLVMGQSFKLGWVPEYLKPPISLMVVLLAYFISNHVQEEAGLLATTAMGITIGNFKLPSINEIRRFNESLGIILISCLFIILTASLEFKQLLVLEWPIIFLLLTILFIARPIVVLLSTIKSEVTWPERILLSWVAPRGVVAAAVAGAFAYELDSSGFADAQILVPLVFVLILTTVVAHGFTLSFVAKRLNLAATRNNGVLIVGASLWSIELAKALIEEKIPVVIAETSWHKLRFARLAGINVYYGQVLSEEAEERLDLSEIGYVIAVSDNDAFNALVCSRFGHELGRNKVFQLPILSDKHQDARDLNPTFAGKQLFGPDHTYEELLRDHFLDWQFQCTGFSEAFKFEDYKKTISSAFLPILIVHSDKSLTFNSGKSLSPKDGEKLLIYTQKNHVKQSSGEAV